MDQYDYQYGYQYDYQYPQYVTRIIQPVTPPSSSSGITALLAGIGIFTAGLLGYYLISTARAKETKEEEAQQPQQQLQQPEQQVAPYPSQVQTAQYVQQVPMAQQQPIAIRGTATIVSQEEAGTAGEGLYTVPSYTTTTREPTESGGGIFEELKNLIKPQEQQDANAPQISQGIRDLANRILSSLGMI